MPGSPEMSKYPGVLGALLAPGVFGAIVLGVAGFNLPLTDDMKPPVRSAMKRPNSPSLAAFSAMASLSVFGNLLSKYCMGADINGKGV